MAEFSNFLGLREGLANVSPAFAILPLPLEDTVSYGHGCAEGPRVLLDASGQVELFDQETNQEPQLEGLFITLPPPDLEAGALEENLETIEQAAQEQINAGRFLIGLGGEHSVSLPLIKATKEKYPQMTVVFFDAHADLRDIYEGTPYSHACVARRTTELDLQIVSAGIRSYSAREYKFMESTSRVKIFQARQCLADTGMQQWREIVDRIDGPIYLSFDVDALDPSVMPGTGTPEPAGLSYDLTCKMIEYLLQKHKMIGLDMVELAPFPGNQVSEFTAARLLFQILLYHLRYNPSF